MLNWWKNISAEMRYEARLEYLGNCVDELSIEQIKEFFCKTLNQALKK
jgi:hypothetical protein